MANLTISNICNLHCPYCFASTHMADNWEGPGPAFIALETFERHLDFLDRSGIEQVRLIGGEPTLHPEFPVLVQRIRQRGKNVAVFSHGLMPERSLACLASLPAEQCTVLINMNASRAPDGPNAQELARRRATLERLGERALPGFTIYKTNFDLTPLLPIIEATGCQRSVRLGLAQPILAGENAYLHPKQYPFVGHKIVQFAQLAAAAGVTLQYDCGFVRCMFPSKDFEQLEQLGMAPAFHCNPILDIDLTGSAVHCFPLTGVVQTPITNGQDARSLRETLSAQSRPFRMSGIYRECSACLYKARGDCTGGCLAATMRRFRNVPFRINGDW